MSRAAVVSGAIVDGRFGIVVGEQAIEVAADGECAAREVNGRRVHASHVGQVNRGGRINRDVLIGCRRFELPGGWFTCAGRRRSRMAAWL